MVIAVSGSTGSIGSELVRLLSRAAIPTRAILRNPQRTQSLSHVVWLQADLADADSLEPALAGTGALFLLTGNDAGFSRVQIGVVRAAERLGVSHVVKLSALGASDHSNSSIAREHWQVEQVLQASRMTWTLLRPHSFMQNWLGDVADSVRMERAIYSPVGNGRVPFIDTRDIAAVALEGLLHPDVHAGKRYFLTGGAAMGYAEVAAEISQAIGAPVTYREISMEEARRRMQARGVPASEIDASLAILAYQKAGGPTSTVSRKVEEILGRPPRTVRDFVRDHISYFTADQTAGA